MFVSQKFRLQLSHTLAHVFGFVIGSAEPCVCIVLYRIFVCIILHLYLLSYRFSICVVLNLNLLLYLSAVLMRSATWCSLVFVFFYEFVCISPLLYLSAAQDTGGRAG